MDTQCPPRLDYFAGLFFFICCNHLNINFSFRGISPPLLILLDITSSCTRFQNLHHMSSSLLEMLDDPDVPTRELALSLLVEILETHVSFSETR